MTTAPRRHDDPLAGPGDVVVPVALELAPTRGRPIIDVADAPTRRTLEPQLTDALGGTRRRRPLLAVRFRLPILRRWSTTYRWEATPDRGASTGPGWTSRWSRNGSGSDAGAGRCRGGGRP